MYFETFYEFKSRQEEENIGGGIFHQSTISAAANLVLSFVHLLRIMFIYFSRIINHQGKDRHRRPRPRRWSNLQNQWARSRRSGRRKDKTRGDIGNRLMITAASVHQQRRKAQWKWNFYDCFDYNGLKRNDKVNHPTDQIWFYWRERQEVVVIKPLMVQ